MWTKKTTNYDFIFIFLQVSVNLTVMLVLTTMFVRWIVTILILMPSSSSIHHHTPQYIIASCFSSVSNDLPRTSYLKMVDIWLIFNLFIPFLEVLLHTYKVSWTFVSQQSKLDKNLFFNLGQSASWRQRNQPPWNYNQGRNVCFSCFCFSFLKVEDLEKKKEPVKLVDMENEINNGRLFDNAFVSTNEEVQVRKHFSIRIFTITLQHKALKIFYETARLSEEKKLEVRILDIVSKS